MTSFREWYLKNCNRPDVEEMQRKRLAKEKKEAQKRLEDKVIKPTTKRPILKSREQIFIHPDTQEQMWSKTFALKKMGIQRATFDRYRKAGWIPKAFIITDKVCNGWEVFTSRQIMLVRRLAKKRIKHHRNVPEFIMYLQETWNDVKTNLAKKPEKHIKGRGPAARDKRTGISREQKKRQAKE